VLSFFVIAPVIVGVFLFVTSTNKTARIFAIMVNVIKFIASIWLLYVTRSEEIITIIGNYSDGVGITLRANTLSADFVFITAFIFLAVSVYSFYDKRDMPLFWFLMFIAEATMIGLFLSGDLFNIFVLVEVSTVVTLVLVMYSRARRCGFSGMVFLVTNVIAAQFYLLGLGYVYMMTGQLDMNAVRETLATIPERDLVLPYALIMTSIAFKCALIPFFSWSPKVRVYLGAPSVVQAILSGLQIKSAVYLLIRFQEVFEPIATSELFLILGVIAGLFGAFMAICQTDIKMILAYHTISQVGLIIVGVSSGNFYSQIGGLYHIFSHAVFKTALFLCSGIIIHAYQSSDVYKIRGVFKRMPIVGVATLMAVLGIIGAPLFIGSISKYFISYDIPFLLNAFTILISLGTIISFIKFSMMFFGKSPKTNPDDILPDNARIFSSFALGVVCLVGGVLGTLLVDFLFMSSVNINLLGYIQKSIIFFVSFGVGYLINKYFVVGNKRLKRIGAMSLSFKSICAAIGVFFAIIIVWVGFL